MIACVCPSCGQKLRAPDEIAGKKVRCPRCSTTLSVGSASATAMPTPAPLASEVLTTALPAPATSEVPTAELVAPLDSSEQQTITGPLRSANRDGPLSLLAPPQSRDEIGRLGDYRVLRLLGQGGMGAVFEAEDTHLNRRVALKVILPEQADETARKRFLREARAAAAIEHDNIVPVFQVGEVEVAGVGRVPFLAMPLLRGETLEARLKRKGQLTSAEVAHIGSQVAVGLAAAHERNLIHRDIKPGNVWLEEKPLDPTLDDVTRRELAQKPRTVVKILDFGLARGADDPREEAPRNKLPALAANKSLGATMLTQDGTIVGTPAYMSPEQVNGQADSRSDLFSLGCMLYQMSTGRLPFEGATAMDTLIAVTSQDPIPPREVNRAMPEPLSKLIVRLLEKHPDDRPKSAMTVARKLSQLTQRHRGVSGLVFGLGSLFCLLGFFCYGLTCVVGVILGLIGWWRGGSDLRKMKVGLMDKAGHGMTMTGYVCSILGTCLNGLGVLVCGGFALFIFGMTSRNKPNPTTTNNRPTTSGISVMPPPGITVTSKPSAADGLVRQADLTDLPAEVIAVLGGRRLRLHGAPHFPAYSRDGKLLASASGNDVILFDAGTGRRGRTLVGHTGRVTALAFDREGKVLLTGSEDASVRVWEVSSGRLLDVWLAGAKVRDLAFSPDGKLLATGTEDGSVRIGTLAEPTRVRSQVHSGAIHRLRFHPGGKLLATIGSDRHVRLLTVDGKQLWSEELAGGDAFALDFNSDGSRMVAGSGEQFATWKVDFGEKLTVTTTGSVKTPAGGLVAFVEDGKAILTAPHKNAGSLERWATEGVQKQPGLKLSATADVLYSTISPDRRTLAWAAHSDRVLSLTELNTGKPLIADELAHTASITGVAFSPDGKMLATADSAGRTLFWDLATGKATKSGPRQEGGVLGLAFSADSNTLASCGKDGLRLWSMSENKETKHLAGEPNGYRCLAFSPDGQHLVVGGEGGAWLYDSGGQGIVKKLADPAKNDLVTACTFSRDSTSVAFAWSSGKVSSHSVGLGKETSWPNAVGGGGRDAVFVHDRLAVLGTSSVVSLWALTGGQESLAGAAGQLHRLAARGDGKLLAACGDDGSVRMWDLSSTLSAPRIQRAIPLAPNGGALRAIGFSPCGRYLAAGGDGGAVYLMRLAVVGQVAQVTAFNAGFTQLATPATGKQRPQRIALTSLGSTSTLGLTGFEDGSVRQWSIPAAQGMKSTSFKWNKGAITALAQSREGKLAVAAGKDRLLSVVEANTGGLRWQKAVPAEVSLLSLTDDGSHVAALLGKEVVLWQADNGTEVSRFSPALEVTSMALSADGGQILLGTTTGPLLLCDHDGKEVRRLNGHRGRVHQVTFSGSTIYSAGADCTVRRWDSGGKEVRQYRGHSGAVLDLCLTPNGKMLVTMGADRTVRLWLADTGVERDRTELGGRRMLRQISCTGAHVIGLVEDGSQATWQLPSLASQ